MKNLSLWIILLAFSSGLTFACNSSTSSNSAAKPAENISAQETQGLLVNGFAVLVDVREADEIKDGMAAPAQWIPFSKIEAGAPEWKAFQDKHPKDKKVIFYCRSGKRAGKAADLLREKGFQAANMGGFSSWTAAGLPSKKP